ncbi:hypothetical protein DN600_17330 [Aeromonas caviae]|nr:hypothetical protein DN600_17330 [Aeromonas caviae]
MKDMVLLLFYFIKATMTNIKKTNQSFFHTTLLFIMKDCKCRLNSVQSPKEGANKRGNSSRLTQSFHFFMFEPIFSPVNALNQPI